MIYTHASGALQPGRPFEIDGRSYPANWLALASPDMLAAAGITVADEPPAAAPAPTSRDVVVERERRLALGFDFDFGDGRGVHHIGTTEDDMRGWAEVTQATQAAVALGMGSMPLTIETATGSVAITAIEWQQILLAATVHRQPIWLASFVLQAMDPIPADFAEDRYWQ